MYTFLGPLIEMFEEVSFARIYQAYRWELGK